MADIVSVNCGHSWEPRRRQEWTAKAVYAQMDFACNDLGEREKYLATVLGGVLAALNLSISETETILGVREAPYE